MGRGPAESPKAFKARLFLSAAVNKKWWLSHPSSPEPHPEELPSLTFHLF